MVWRYQGASALRGKAVSPPGHSLGHPGASAHSWSWDRCPTENWKPSRASGWAGGWKLALGQPGQLGTKRRAPFEKKREPPRSEAKILHGTFLLCTHRLWGLLWAGQGQQNPSRKQQWGGGTWAEIFLGIAVLRTEMTSRAVQGRGAPANLQGFQLRLPLECGETDRPAPTKSTVYSQLGQGTPCNAHQPAKGSIPSLYSSAFTVHKKLPSRPRNKTNWPKPREKHKIENRK